MKKIVVIHHSADFDGIFCREIAFKFLGPSAQYIGWDYGDAKIPFPEDATVYVLDLSPECLDGEIVWANLIWIDHHKSAIEKFAPEIPGYRIDGVAACRLAWQYFSKHKNLFHPSAGSFAVSLPGLFQYQDRTVIEPYAVRLVGEYDIWDKRDPNAEVFQFGLRSRDLTPDDWRLLLKYKTNDEMYLEAQLLDNGKLLQRYQRETDASIVEHRSFLVEFEGLKFLALNTARCNSLTFATRDQVETGHDALMGFYCDGTLWKVSLYHALHRKDLDLSTIAVKHGGGGHRGACGFVVGKLPFVGRLPWLTPEAPTGAINSLGVADQQTLAENA